MTTPNDFKNNSSSASLSPSAAPAASMAKSEEMYAEKSPISAVRKVVYTSTDYRRFQVALIMRISIFMCCLMVLFNVLLTLSLMQLGASMRVDSAIITNFSSTEKMVDVDPVALDMSHVDAINEIMLKQYIITRHTILPDAALMRWRWMPNGELYWMSTNRVYLNFYKSAAEFESRIAAIETGAEQPVEVEIKDIRKVADNLWNIDFDTLSYNSATGLTKRQSWNVSVRGANLEWGKVLSNFLINPLGFVVTEYNLAPKVVK